MRLSRGHATALKLASLAFVLLVGLPYAVIPVYRFPRPAPFSGSAFFNPYAHLTGTWQRANLHTHGRAWIGLTSGRHSNEEVIRRYRDLGYTVAGISNYQDIAAQHGVPTLPLYEHGYNLGKHHQLAIGAHRVEWLDLPIWQSRSDKQFLIDRVAATTDLVAIVHPASRNAYSPEDLKALTGYQLLEIVNGKFPHDEPWDAALSAGRPVWALGNDDNHDLEDDDRLAVAWTMIDAATPSTEDIVQALGAGRSYAVLRTGEGSTDADIALAALTFSNGTLRLSISGAPATISFIGQNGDVRKTVKETSSAEYTFNPADTYVRAVARTPRTTIYLNPVVRYDGVALPAATAVVDPLQTWLLRGLALSAVIAATALYRRRRRTRGATVSAVLFAVLASAPTALSAQDLPLASTYDAEVLADLPLSDNVFAVLETMQPSLISDRFSNGGVDAAEAARIGGFLSSWTQTMYRVGTVDVTDPTSGGVPLVFPDLMLWRQVTAQTGLLPSDVNASGLAVSLEPRRPAVAWAGAADASTSHFRSAKRSAPPPAAALDGWDRVAAFASGPIANRAGIFVGGSWSHASQIERNGETTARRSLGSAVTHLVLNPSDRDEVRTVAVLQRANYPFLYRVPFAQPDASTTRNAVHVQAAWNRASAPVMKRWRVYAGYTARKTAHDYDPSTGARFERLLDGSLSELAWTAPGDVHTWSAGVRLGPSTSTVAHFRHAPELGVEIGGARAYASRFAAGILRESVDGQPARLWNFITPGIESMRSERTLAVDVADRLDLGRHVAIDASLRFDTVKGSARDAIDNIRWHSWLPQVRIRWGVVDAWQAAIVGGYRRAAYRLPLDFLAVGDPAAPVASIFRWSGVPPAVAIALPPVMRVGPGTGGSPGFSRIDADLTRPLSDEVAVGIEAKPTGNIHVGWTGIARRERNLVRLLNAGAPRSAYSTTMFSDPGADVLNPEDDRVVAVYNRRPDTFGIDRYVLTNADGDEATFKGFEITARYSSRRLLVLTGATAGIAGGSAASRGFGPLENDQSRLGELDVNPNAGTFARGRLFNDRAYTVKLAGAYKFRDDLRVGVIARYQDGQPFARMLIVPNLNQGPEAVRAFPNGDSRFTYTATLDARLQKLFVVSGKRLAAVLDAYNLVNMANEVEEVTTAPPGVRIASAVQPPRTIHVGVRVGF